MLSRGMGLVAVGVWVMGCAVAHAQDTPGGREPSLIDEGELVDIPLDDLIRPDPPSLFPGSPSASLRTQITIRCRVTAESQRCTFDNLGNATGHACVRATLTGAGDSSVRSEELCCEPLAAGGTVVLPLVFAGEPPSAVCVRDGRPDYGACRLTVETTSVSVDEGVPMWLAQLMPLLSFGLVILATVWVGWDAHKRRLANPGAWIAGTLLLCAIAFPLYVFWGRNQRNPLDLEDEPETPDPPLG